MYIHVGFCFPYSLGDFSFVLPSLLCLSWGAGTAPALGTHHFPHEAVGSPGDVGGDPQWTGRWRPWRQIWFEIDTKNAWRSWSDMFCTLKLQVNTFQSELRGTRARRLSGRSLWQVHAWLRSCSAAVISVVRCRWESATLHVPWAAGAVPRFYNWLQSWAKWKCVLADLKMCKKKSDPSLWLVLVGESKDICRKWVHTGRGGIDTR